MTYKNIEPFVKEYGVRKSFFVDYFKKQEKQGKSKNEIQAEAIRNEIVKSPIWAAKENIIARNKNLGWKKPWPKWNVPVPIPMYGFRAVIINKEKKENINDPKTPDKVLLGLIEVNFFHLKIFPKTYPPTSEHIQRMIIHKSR